MLSVYLAAIAGLVASSTLAPFAAAVVIVLSAAAAVLAVAALSHQLESRRRSPAGFSLDRFHRIPGGHR